VGGVASLPLLKPSLFEDFIFDLGASAHDEGKLLFAASSGTGRVHCKVYILASSEPIISRFAKLLREETNLDD
jgi:hypothetical protein